MASFNRIILSGTVKAKQKDGSAMTVETEREWVEKSGEQKKETTVIPVKADREQTFTFVEIGDFVEIEGRFTSIKETHNGKTYDKPIVTGKLV